MRKFWLDDVRPSPSDEWEVFHSVNEFLKAFSAVEDYDDLIVSLDHDLGDYSSDGGDGYQVVLFMAEFDKWPLAFRVHSANPVGVEKMLAVAERYGDYNPTFRGNTIRQRCSQKIVSDFFK